MDSSQKSRGSLILSRLPLHHKQVRLSREASLLQVKWLQPLSPSWPTHTTNISANPHPESEKLTNPQQPMYFLPLKSTSGTVARKDHGSSRARTARLSAVRPLLASLAGPSRQPTRRAQVHFRRTRRWQWERRGRRREAADRRLRLRFMAALPPRLGSVGSGGARGGPEPEPEPASRAGTCARRRWGAACEEATASSARRASPPAGMATTAELFEVGRAALRGVAGRGCRLRGAGRGAGVRLLPGAALGRKVRTRRGGAAAPVSARAGRGLGEGRLGDRGAVGRAASPELEDWKPRRSGAGRCRGAEPWALTQGAEGGAGAPGWASPV